MHTYTAAGDYRTIKALMTLAEIARPGSVDQPLVNIDDLSVVVSTMLGALQQGWAREFRSQDPGAVDDLIADLRDCISVLEGPPRGHGF